MDAEDEDNNTDFYPPMQPNDQGPKIARLRAELEGCSLEELEALNNKTPEDNTGFCNA
jgi:hypothetical protein